MCVRERERERERERKRERERVLGGVLLKRGTENGTERNETENMHWHIRIHA